jgi:hypothetical protein
VGEPGEDRPAGGVGERRERAVELFRSQRCVLNRSVI